MIWVSFLPIPLQELMEKNTPKNHSKVKLFCFLQFNLHVQTLAQNIQRNKKKLGHVKIVSFVTDGYGKSVDNLKDMDFILNDQVVNYDPEIWIIAKGDPKQVYNISRNGNNLLQKGDKYFGGEAFQELLLLADKENHLRMVLEGNEEGMVRQMFQHMALLDKQYDKEAYRKKHPKK